MPSFDIRGFTITREKTIAEDGTVTYNNNYEWEGLKMEGEKSPELGTELLISGIEYLFGKNSAIRTREPTIDVVNEE
ncbi:hypothetical protein SAMN04487948_12437 [Halogranum amylolyticum]|uniref:Uncharacterized protein n=1 Tax=Halogranum amylolyticum TaxID=660520 RepID=A0A1H8W7V0_9EURY|nr:hypothetical protein [Halogranum amylolyticum]SEP23218.1 hypothetical protein SAMN04487948_12437 [Halogranum amylolyticum]